MISMLTDGVQVREELPADTVQPVHDPARRGGGGRPEASRTRQPLYVRLQSQ